MKKIRTEKEKIVNFIHKIYDQGVRTLSNYSFLDIINLFKMSKREKWILLDYYGFEFPQKGIVYKKSAIREIAIKLRRPRWTARILEAIEMPCENIYINNARKWLKDIDNLSAITGKVRTQIRLTKPEKEKVIAMIKEGTPNKKIARIMGVSAQAIIAIKKNNTGE